MKVKKRRSRYVTREELWWGLMIFIMIYQHWSFWWMAAVVVVYGVYSAFRKEETEDEP